MILAAISIAVSTFAISRLPGFAACAKYMVVYLFGMGIFAISNHLKTSWCIAVVTTCSVIFGASAWVLFHVNNTIVGRLLDLSMAFTGSGMACAIAYIIVQYNSSLLCRCMMWCGKTSLEIYAVHWCLLFHTNLLCLNRLVGRGFDVYSVAFIGAMAWMIISVVFITLLRALPGGRIVFSGFAIRNAPINKHSKL